MKTETYTLINSTLMNNIKDLNLIYCLEVQPNNTVDILVRHLYENTSFTASVMFHPTATYYSLDVFELTLDDLDFMPKAIMTFNYTNRNSLLKKITSHLNIIQ